MRGLDSAIKIGFVIALLFLAFSAGVLTAHFKGPGYRYYADALEGWRAWQQKRASIAVRNPPPIVADTDNKLLLNGPEAYAGYTLLCYRQKDMSRVILVDMNGVIVHRWNIPFYKAWPHPGHLASPLPEANIYLADAYMYPNGDLLAVYEGSGDTPYGYGMAKWNKDGKPLWTYSSHAHHVVSVAASGELYVPSHRFADFDMPKGGVFHQPMLLDTINILSPDGRQEKEISVSDAFIDTPYEAMIYPKPNDRKAWDMTHINSIMRLEADIAGVFPLFKAGQILVSLRKGNVIAVIDPDSKKAVWAMSGPWKVQHGAQFLPNGHIMLFDNRGAIIDKENRVSRVLEIDPATRAIAWSYDGSAETPLFSTIKGNAQRLPNGNTLIVEAIPGRVFEVTPDKRTVWAYKTPISLSSAYRIPYGKVTFLAPPAVTADANKR